jgi:hypothetical protein
MGGTRPYRHPRQSGRDDGRISWCTVSAAGGADGRRSTDDTDPQSQILYEVYLNGERFDDGVIGYGATITYCRAEGPTEIALRAVDTSGNVSAPSNALLFSC